jgi:hypothetical protein
MSASQKENMSEIAIWSIIILFALVTVYTVVKGQVKEVTLELVPVTFSIRISVKLVNRK